MRTARQLRTRATLMLFSTSIFWGLSFPLGRALNIAQTSVVPGVSTVYFSSVVLLWRFGLAAFVLAIVGRGNAVKMTTAELRQGCWLGFCAAGGLLLQMDALYFIDASASAFLTQTSCIFVPAVVAIRTRRVPPRVVIVCCALVLLGVGVLCRVSWRQFQLGRGEAETILAAAFFSAQILFLQRRRFEKNRSQPVTIVMFATIAVALLPVAWHGAPHALDILTIWRVPIIGALIAALTLLCTLCTFTIMNHWQKHVSATEASLIYCFEPVFATIFALFVPGLLSWHPAITYANEVFGLTLVVGGFLIIAANLLLGWHASRSVV